MSTRARVAMLTPYGAAQKIGGVEIFNEGLRRALGDLEVFAGGIPPDPSRYGDLRRVGLQQPVGAWRAAQELLQRHREEPFDVILSNGVYGWPLTLVNPGVPLVQVYHFTMAGLARHALSMPGDRWTTGHVTAFFDRVAGIGKHVVAISPRVLREIRMYYGLRGRLIPHAVDMQAFCPTDSAAARETLGLPAERPIGLFVGRPDPTKGFDILLEVARRMPDVLFVVAGAPPSRDGNVWAVGRVPHSMMPAWYAASDFFFFPSRYEGFGLALLEAFACDVPAVVTQAAWPFVDPSESCGIVVPNPSVGEFVHAIRTLLSTRSRFAPRDFVLPHYDVGAFEAAWRGFIEGLQGAGG